MKINDKSEHLRTNGTARYWYHCCEIYAQPSFSSTTV